MTPERRYRLKEQVSLALGALIFFVVVLLLAVIALAEHLRS